MQKGYGASWFFCEFLPLLLFTVNLTATIILAATAKPAAAPTIIARKLEKTWIFCIYS